MPEENQDEMPEQTEEAAGSSKSKLSLKTLILIGLPLIMVQAVFAYILVSNYIEPHLPETKLHPENIEARENEEEDAKDLSEYSTFPVKDIIANPAETGGQRYLSLSLNVYVTEENLEAITSLEPEIRSLVIERITRKRMDELDDYKDQQILREEIREDMNATIAKYFSQKLKDFKVPRIVFSRYTIQ